MTSKKQTAIHNATMTRSRAANSTGGTIPRLADDRSRITEDTGSSSPQEPVASIQSSQQHENQPLQMLYKMIEKMKEQQEQFDRKRER